MIILISSSAGAGPISGLGFPAAYRALIQYEDVILPV